MTDSAPDSPVSPSTRAYKRQSKVLTAAEQFEISRSAPRVDVQQQVVTQDMERLSAAKRVSTHSSYEGGLGSPTSSSRPVSIVSYGSPAPSTQPQVESPGSALASRMSVLSIGDDSAGGQQEGSSRKKGLFGAFSSPTSRSSPGLKSTNATDAQVESASPLGEGGLGLGLKGVGGSTEALEGKENQRTPTGKAVKRSASKHELALLVISSGITELSMSIQEVNTLLFEIQELRHTSAPSVPSAPPLAPSLSSRSNDFPSNSNSEASLSPSMTSDTGSTSNEQSRGEPSAPSQVDAALMRLESKLETVGKEYSEVQKQAQDFFDGSPSDGEDTNSQISFLRRKWQTTVHEWTEAQKDAEILGEELKEDKWIIVFRTVSQQAEDMMKSLEKVLTQSSDFVLDITRRKAKMDGGQRPPRTPGTSSFGDASNMQLLLTSFVALHQSLHAKVKYYSPACDRVLKILGKGIADRSTKNGEVLRKFAEMKSRWRNLLERIARIEVEMKGVEEMLKEAAGPLSCEGGQLTPSKSERNVTEAGGELSPFRRLANKVTRSSPSTAQSSVTPRSTSLSNLPRPSSASGQYPPPAQTPPRPPKSTNRRLVSGGLSPGSTPPRTPVTLNHRRSVSAMNLEVPRSASTSVSSGMGVRPSSRQALSSSRRAPSPAMSNNGAEKPRWNISTKREDTKDTIRSSRPPLSASASASQLALGQSAGRRSSSRLSMSGNLSRSYLGARPTSPAYSDASSSVIRDRPFTPSRIPAPSPASRHGGTNPFSSLDDPEPSSLLQRAMSPTPSTGSHRPLGVSRRASSSRSHLSTPGGLSPPRASSPTPSNSSYNRYRAMTPEPSLQAQAKRMTHVRMPSSSKSPRPPVPSLPASYRRESMIATPRASLAPPPRRPSSAASIRTETAPSDGNGGYTPNPIDPLDSAVAETVRSLPLQLEVERVDPPLSLAQVCQAEVLQARYYFSLPGGRGLENKPMMVKLVDRVGHRVAKGEKRVLVRVAGGWQGLDAYGMSLLAAAV